MFFFIYIYFYTTYFYRWVMAKYACTKCFNWFLFEELTKDSQICQVKLQCLHLQCQLNCNCIMLFTFFFIQSHLLYFVFTTQSSYISAQAYYCCIFIHFLLYRPQCTIYTCLLVQYKYCNTYNAKSTNSVIPLNVFEVNSNTSIFLVHFMLETLSSSSKQ